MNVSTRFRAAMALVMTGVLGGVAPLLMKFAFKEFAPMQIVFLRFLIAVLLMLPVVFYTTRLTIRQIGIALPAGFFFSGNILFIIVGLMTTTGIVSQLFYLLTPVIVSLVGYMVFGEPVSKRRIMSMAVCFAGSSILVVRSIQAHELAKSIGTIGGNLLVLCAVLSWSGYLIYTKRVSTKLPATGFLIVNFMVTLFLSFLFLTFGGMSPLTTLTAFSKSSVPVLMSIVTLGTINSVLFFFLYQWSIKRVSAFMVSAAAYLSPLSAALFGIPFFGEKLSGTLVISAVAIFIGSYLIMTEKK
jgi:drug/metabolite transporter (DMT)-like permease